MPIDFVCTTSIVTFIWDASNTEHLERHKVTPQEAVEAILLDSVEPELQHHSDEERVLCFGRRASGRLLTIIYTRWGMM